MVQPSKKIGFTLFLSLSVLAVGCHSNPGIKIQKKGQGKAYTTSSIVSVGDRAPDVFLRGLEGGKRLSSFRGHPVLLSFWASWCGPCVEELPSLQRLYVKLRRRGLQVIAVSIDDPAGEAEVKSLVKKLSLTFPIVLDQKQEIAARYGVTGLPDNLVIDRRGVIVLREFGPQKWEEEVNFSFIKKLLG